MIRLAMRALAGAMFAAALVPALATSTPTPTIDVPSSAQYGTLEIPMNLAVAMGLNCNLTDTGLTCYQTEAEALDALVTTASLTAAASCTPAMSLYDGTSFTGANVNITVQSVWLNLSGLAFSNRTSSWRTGCAGGYLADGAAGAGTRIGMAAGGQQSSLGTFNNLASSALRCPC